MPRKPDERIEQAKELYLKGQKLIEIAKQLDLPEGTIRSWKNRYRWDNGSDATLQKNECNVAKDKHIKKDEAKAIADEVNQVIGNPELTDKQRLFCCLYVKCFNATKAYQKAYEVDYVTALVAGPRLLGNVRVKEEILKLKQNRLNREFLSEADIFQKYMDIAFADITDYVEFGREIVPVMGPFGPVVVKNEETGEKIEVKKEVNIVRFKESIEVDGTLITEVKQGRDGASIKLADRMKALQWISDHMDLATAEQQARIEVLKSQSKILQSKINDGDDTCVADDGFLDALNGFVAEDWTDEDVTDI